MRVYSHSYWQVIFCTTNSSRVLARERWQTFEQSWKKNTIFIYLLIKHRYINRDYRHNFSMRMHMNLSFKSWYIYFCVCVLRQQQSPRDPLTFSEFSLPRAQIMNFTLSFYKSFLKYNIAFIVRNLPSHRMRIFMCCNNVSYRSMEV